MNLFKKIFVYMFWIVYVLKFQRTDKQEILCELKIALRDKLRKLFILLPSPKDKYYELIPLILSLAIEITLNSEITTITEKKNNVTSPPKNTYDYECKQDLFQTVYYEIIGFLPSAYFIENIILKYTKEENKLGISSNYLKDKKKSISKPILKGVKKNLCNVLSNFYKDQSRNNLLNFTTMNKTTYSKMMGSAFASNSNIIQPVSISTLPPLSMSPTRTHPIDPLDETELEKPLSKKEIEYSMKSVKFSTSTLSPCFDHIYQCFQSPSPKRSTTILHSTSDLLKSPQLKKPIKLQVLKPAHSLLLKHRSEYEVDVGKKCNFEVMFDAYEQASKRGS